MKIFNILATTGKVQDNKKFPRMVFQLRAESIDNLRRNLIHRKYPKNDTWYYEIWSEAGTPLGTLSINTYEERIRNNPISKKYRQDGDRLQWIAPKNDKVWIVDPKTGALKKRIR